MDAPPAIADASDLAATVERARALLTDGDVIAARFLAAAAYEQAKAQGKLAEQFGAAEQLVAKARRLQGDALLIEVRAKLRIADDYDAAQAAGAVASRGKPKNIPDGNNIATAADYGLSAKEVYEARKLREAERRTPGIAERAILARVAQGLSPTRANLRAAIGTDSASKEERGNNLYETPPEAVRPLLALEAFGPFIWEPACGKGAISRMLEEAGHEVAITDLVDYGTTDRYGVVMEAMDFLTTRKGVAQADYIITNPPYGEALNAFVAHALRVHRPRKMALLLNLNFLCGTDDSNRNFALDECPPARVLVFSRRLPMMHRDGWEGDRASSRMNTAWFIWEQDGDGNYAGRREVSRVDWKDYQDTPPLAVLDPNAPSSSRVQSVEAGAATPPAAPASEGGRKRRAKAKKVLA